MFQSIFTSMLKALLICCLTALSFSLHATDYSGIYSYNKGMNKAGATLYLSHFSEDSAFFLIQAMSGMPDFFTTEIKGFIRIDNGLGIYQPKDSCRIEFIFTTSSCTISENGYCKNEFGTDGKYKKTATKVKKGIGLLPGFSDKSGTITQDSTSCYSIPHYSSPSACSLLNNESVTITDEFNGFYLIEIKSKKNEFLWVPKKNIQLAKKR